MPTHIQDFISGLMTLGRAFGTSWATIDSKFHRDHYYKLDRDVPIINAVRRLYARTFVERPFPSELRYEHESQDEKSVLTPDPTPPSNGHFQPPYLLLKDFSINDCPLGDNLIHLQCRNAVLTIQDYLNGLNKEASSFFNSMPIFHYGHRSDAVRFVCLLIINAFVRLSQMDLNELRILKEATAYIEFLSNLKHDPQAVEAFQKIDTAQGKQTPLSVIVNAISELKKIKEVILYHQSKCSIFEQVSSLHVQTQKLIENAFVFSVYIMSASPIVENDTAIRPQKTSRDDAQVKTLPLLRGKLAGVLHDLSVSDDVESSRLLDAKSSVLAAHPGSNSSFYYDKTSCTWVGIPDRSLSNENTGAYSVLVTSQSRVQEFTKHNCQLVLLGKLGKGLAHLKHLLRTGGDLLAVARLCKEIRLNLKQLGYVNTGMRNSQKELMAFADNHHSDLCRISKLTDEARIWKKNYDHFKAIFPPELDRRTLEENFTGSIAKIEAILSSWAHNPMEKLEEFRRAKQSFNGVISEVNGSLALLDEQFRVDFEALDVGSGEHLPRITEQATHETDRTDGQTTRARRTAVVEEPPVVSSVIEEIKQSLTEYSAEKRYSFNLPKVDESIHLGGAKRRQKWKLDKSIETDPDEEARIDWIYDCFCVLYSESSEQEILQDLSDEIFLLRQTPAKEKHFKSRRTGGIENRINEIKKKIDQRLSVIAAGVASEGRSSPERAKAERQNFDANAEQVEMANIYSPTNQETSSENVAKLASAQPSVTEPKMSAPIGSDVESVSTLRSWVNHHLDGKMTQKGRDEFLEFWRKLCYLDEAAKVKTFHATHLHDKRVAERSTEFFNEVKEGLSAPAPKPIQDWAGDTVSHLAGSAITVETTPDKWVASKIKSTQTQLAEIAKREEAYKKKQFGLGSSARVAWSEEGYQLLESFIHKLNHWPLGSKEMKTFLDAISHRIFQDESTLSWSEQVNDSFDQYLKSLLVTHSQLQNKSEKIFYEEIIRGLLALGASPLLWINEQIEASSSIIVSAERGRACFLIAQQTKLVLSQLEHRSRYLGESAAFLEQSLDTLFNAINTFGERLYCCVESDDAWWWKGFSWMFHYTGGARLERSAVYWSVLKLVYIVLNEGLVSSGKCVNESEAYLSAKKSFEAANDAYKKIAPEKEGAYNFGREAWMILKTAIESVDSKIVILGTMRRNHELALNNDEERREKEEERRQKEEERREKEEERREKEEERRQKEAANQRVAELERQLAALKRQTPAQPGSSRIGSVTGQSMFRPTSATAVPPTQAQSQVPKQNFSVN